MTGPAHTWAWRAAFVVALVALAGCSGFFAAGGGGGESTPADVVTPAPVPNDTASPVPTPVSSFPDAPPGIGVDGITDLDALYAAHRSILANRSFTVEYRRTGDSRGAVPFEYTVRAASGSRYVIVGPDGRSLVYVDSFGAFERGFDVSQGRIRNVTDEVRVRPGADPRPSVPFVLHSFPRSVDVTRIERDGTTYYRLHATEPPESRQSAWTNYSATAYVRADGLVKTVDLRYDERSEEEVEEEEDPSAENGDDRTDEQDGTDERDGADGTAGQRVDPPDFVYRFTYTDVGSTTVETPAWARRVKRTRSTAGPDGYPQGLGPDGVESAAALRDAHRFVLQNRSFTLLRAGDHRWENLPPNGTVHVENESTYRFRHPEVEIVYADPTGRYVRQIDVRGNPTDDGVRVEDPRSWWSNRLRDGDFWLTARDSNVTRVERNGTTRFRVTFETPPRNVEVSPENFTATALIRPSGLMERLRLDLRVRVDASTGGATEAGERWIDVTYTYEYRQIGNTTVTEPGWVTRVKRNRTNGVPRSFGPVRDRSSSPGWWSASGRPSDFDGAVVLGEPRPAGDGGAVPCPAGGNRE